MTIARMARKIEPAGSVARWFLARRAKIDREDRALPELALDLERGAVAIDDVLDDGEAEPGAAHRARASRVDAVEALGEARNVLPRDALATVAHGDSDMRAAAGPALGELGRDLDGAAL